MNHPPPFPPKPGGHAEYMLKKTIWKNPNKSIKRAAQGKARNHEDHKMYTDSSLLYQLRYADMTIECEICKVQII